MANNLRVKWIMPPWKPGDVVPADAFPEGIRRHHLDCGAVVETTEPATVALSVSAVAPTDESAAQEENADLRRKLGDLPGKLAAAESDLAKSKAAIERATKRIEELTGEATVAKASLADAQAEVKRLTFDLTSQSDLPGQLTTAKDRIAHLELELEAAAVAAQEAAKPKDK